MKEKLHSLSESDIAERIKHQYNESIYTMQMITTQFYKICSRGFSPICMPDIWAFFCQNIYMVQSFVNLLYRI